MNKEPRVFVVAAFLVFAIFSMSVPSYASTTPDKDSQSQGDTHYKAGRFADAEACYKRALQTREEKFGQDHASVAQSLNKLAMTYRAMGRYSEAEPLYKRSLGIREAKLGKDHPDVAQSLNNLGLLYYQTGRYAEAEPLYERSLKIWEAKLGRDHAEVAVCLNNIAMLYRALGRYREAEPLYKRSLEIREAKLGKDDPGVALTLNNLALLYCSSGRYAEAESLFRRSLAIWEAKLGKDHPQVALGLANTADLYRLLGRYAEAEPLYKRSLEIREARLGKDHPDVASSLTLLGVLYRTRGRYAEAEALYKRALEIREAKLGKDHPALALSLNNLAFLYLYSRRYAEAEPLFKRSLEIREAKFGKNHIQLAVTLNNLALLYRSTGRYAEAESLLRRALPIAQNGMNPDTLRYVQENYSRLLGKQGRREAAIFYAKQAVNTTQGLRRDAATIDKETLEAYQGKVAPVYKYLSNLLIEAGRLSEAQQVLDLLKQEEYKDYTVRNAGDGDDASARATLTSVEAALDTRYRDAAEPLARFGVERGALLDKKLRTREEESRLATLDQELEKAGEAFQKAIDDIHKELFAKRPDKVEQVKEAQGLQEDLRELGAGTVALYTVVGEEKYHVLLIAPDFRKAFEVPVTEANLNRKITDLLRALKDPRSDPRPLAREVYDIIFSPMEQDLKDLNAETLMWSLDGVLRYLPVVALYDGERYLIERYRNVMFTPASQARLLNRPSAQWKGLGLGVSRGYPGFDPLPAVRGELSGIFRQADGSNGVLPGLINLDDAFTLEAMKDGLRKRYPLVHIASHFVFTPGDDTKSYLLLGDGRRLPLSDIKVQNNLFGGVELLTLSACNTAVGDGKDPGDDDGVGDGKEVESFGVLAQRQGAKGVIATLWQVADDSTGLFMQNFYRLREQEKLSKAEALRRTQMMFIDGRLPGTRPATQGLKVVSENADGRNSAGTYAHPYFWAPFLLIGNWL